MLEYGSLQSGFIEQLREINIKVISYIDICVEVVCGIDSVAYDSLKPCR